jgi:hypothetical protein
MELSQRYGYGLPEVRWYRWFLQSRYQRCSGPVVSQHAYGARRTLTEQWLCGSAEEAEDGWERCGITEEPEPLQECQARVRFWLIAEPLLKHSSGAGVPEASQGNGGLSPYHRARIGLQQRA